MVGYRLTLAALVCLGFSGCRSADSSSVEVADLSPAPDMALELLDGSPFRLSDYAGQVVLVNFWGTWCPPCRMEIPHFVDLYEAYRDRDVVVLGVALNESSAEAVREFRDEHGITYPLALGSAADLNRLWSAVADVDTYRNAGGQSAPEAGSIREVPTTFVIDSEGRVFEKHVGYRERRHLEPVVQKLLKRRSARRRADAPVAVAVSK